MCYLQKPWADYESELSNDSDLEPIRGRPEVERPLVQRRRVQSSASTENGGIPAGVRLPPRPEIDALPITTGFASPSAISGAASGATLRATRGATGSSNDRPTVEGNAAASGAASGETRQPAVVSANGGASDHPTVGAAVAATVGVNRTADSPAASSAADHQSFGAAIPAAAGAPGDDDSPSDEDTEVDEEDFNSLFDSFSSQWLNAQLTHHVSLTACNTFWNLSFKYVSKILEQKNNENIKRKIPQFLQIRKNKYKDICPDVKMKFVFLNKTDQSIINVNEDHTPLKEFDRNPQYQKLYEEAHIEVIAIASTLTNPLTILYLQNPSWRAGGREANNFLDKL